MFRSSSLSRCFFGSLFCLDQFTDLFFALLVCLVQVQLCATELQGVLQGVVQCVSGEVLFEQVVQCSTGACGFMVVGVFQDGDGDVLRLAVVRQLADGLTQLQVAEVVV